MKKLTEPRVSGTFVKQNWIGNANCKHNAWSPDLRCAINPCGPCEDCKDFEPRSHSGLNKSIADAGWAQFIDILSFKVNPKNTSQVCSNCLNVVPKELKDRWHNCERCNLSIDRDTNSAILIKKVGFN